MVNCNSMEKLEFETVETTTMNRFALWRQNLINFHMLKWQRQTTGTVFFPRSAERFPRHSNANHLITEILASGHIFLVLETSNLYRTDERPDGLRLVAWNIGKQFLWDIQ